MTIAAVSLITYASVDLLRAVPSGSPGGKRETVNLPPDAKPGEVWMAPPGSDPDDPCSWVYLGRTDQPVQIAAGDIFAGLPGPQVNTESAAYAQAIRGGTIGETWYLATCQECGEPGRPLPQPFTDYHERAKWARAHRAATGHMVEYSEEQR